MNPRADILARIRLRTRRERGAADRIRRAVEDRLADRKIGPRPLIRGELLNAFIDRAEGQSCTTEVADERSEIPGLVAAWLSAQGLPLTAVIWPEFSDLDWAGAGVDVLAEGAREGDQVGITGCFCAIAETGTLMLCSHPLRAATTSLLPETHIALVDISRIQLGMEEAWDLARRELGKLPRAVNFISGPSRTGDIEQTIVRPAHGPKNMHVIVTR
jgi:L-lactate dehydrogenase complex protein LldG